MNAAYKDLKERMRKLDALLQFRGPSGNLGFAQALSFLHRAERQGDRTRDPSPALASLLARAEDLARRMA